MKTNVRIEDLYNLRMRFLALSAVDEAVEFPIRDLDQALSEWSLYERAGNEPEKQQAAMNFAFFAAVGRLVLGRKESIDIMQTALNVMIGRDVAEVVYAAIDSEAVYA